MRLRVVISILGATTPTGMNKITEGEYEEIEMAVDSGAGEMVMNEEMVGCVGIVGGETQRRGVQYEVANGTLLPNMGETRFEAMAEDVVVKKMVARVTRVNRVLLSVKSVTSQETLVFKKGVCYIEEDKTGEEIWMKEKDRMYV